MKAIMSAAAGAVIMAAIGGAVWAGRGIPKETRSTAIKSGAGADASPVVVELFTSEGCSSCPPADMVLAKLEQSGVPVIALGLHVDYWNRLGWADPFSSRQFSDRQNEYAEAFHTNSVYTPQMVVDGRAEFVGSDETRANAEIANATRRPKARVSFTIQGGTQKDAVSLRAEVGVLPPGVRTGEVVAALTESGLSSQVARGENAGRHLAHASVVRKLVSLGTVGPKGGTLTGKVGVPAAVRAVNAHMVVFVQDKATHQIVGAAQAGPIQAAL